MKRLIFLLVIFTIYGCSKPKTVLICGDHVCINKAEANQYFEDNLTLEVRIIDNTGRIVLNENVSGSNATINVANLVSGIYFIELSMANQ